MTKPQLENGYTRIANEIVEAMCQLKCTNYESRFLWCLFRKTYGFQKKNDRISLTQFSKMTGIGSQHIARTKTKLLAKNIIVISGDKIGFQKNISRWIVPNEVVPDQVVPSEVIPSEVIPNEVIGSTWIGNRVVPNEVLTKETITKETKQKKEYTTFSELESITKQDIDLLVNKYGGTEAFVYSCIDDMGNWIEQKGKTGSKGSPYINYLAALRKWYKKAVIQIKQGGERVNKYKTIDATKIQRGI